MPASLYTDNAPGRSTGVSKLSRALSKLNLRSPTEADQHDIHALRKEQIKWLTPSHPNARNILTHISTPPGLTKHRVRDYIHSISITPKGKPFLPQYSEIIPGYLFISDHFTGTDAATLSRLHITHVVSILHTPNQNLPMLPTIEYRELVVPIEAHQVHRLLAKIDDTVDFIDKALRQDDTRVLVHCRTGAHWSASMVIAWFMRNGDCDYETAREAVRRKREVIDPGLDLQRGVKEWWALELARPLFPLGRGGRRDSLESSPSLKLLKPDLGYESHSHGGKILEIK